MYWRTIVQIACRKARRCSEMVSYSGVSVEMVAETESFAGKLDSVRTFARDLVDNLHPSCPLFFASFMLSTMNA